jgi:hypothetical protein
LGHRIGKTRCKLCAHPERARVEFLRISGVGLDAIATEFELSRDSIWRHMRDHVSEADRAAYLVDVPLDEMLARAADEGASLLDYFRIIRATLMQQFQLAASVNDRRAVAAIAGRLNEVLLSIGGCTGELLKLAPSVTNNNTAIFIQSAMFSDLQAMLLQRLAPFPDALREVVTGLLELDAKAADIPLAAEQPLLQERTGAA